MSRYINLNSLQKVFSDTISKLSKRFISKERENMIGRWYIDYDMKTINNKIDRANQDHCGPCGYYVKTKQNK